MFSSAISQRGFNQAGSGQDNSSNCFPPIYGVHLIANSQGETRIRSCGNERKFCRSNARAGGHMFTDHMFFSRTLEVAGILVLLTSIAKSYRAHCVVKCLNANPLHSAPGIPAHSNPNILPAAHKFDACCSSSCGSGKRAGRTVRDLSPSGPCIPANGKEETSC